MYVCVLSVRCMVWRVHNMSPCVCCYVCGGGTYRRCWDWWWVNLWGGESFLQHGGENNPNLGQILREGLNILQINKLFMSFRGFHFCGDLILPLFDPNMDDVRL